MTTDGATHPLDRSLTPAVLRLLVLVEDLGGVGAAARACGVSQPSASRALAGVEGRLGCLLLRRTALGSSLTPEGLALAAQARLVLKAYDQLESLAHDLSRGTPGHVRLAAPWGSNSYRVGWVHWQGSGVTCRCRSTWGIPMR